MNLEKMRSRVQGYLGGRSDATNTLVDDYINNAYREIATSFFFDRLEETDASITTADGTAAYSKPSALYAITHVRDTTNDVPLTGKDMDWYNEQDQDAEGEPTHYIEFEDQIIFWPEPDGAYAIQLRGVKAPTALSATTDEPVFPEDWHMVIVLRAAADLCFYFAMDTRGMTLRNEELSKISTRQEKRTIRRRHQQGKMVPMRKGHNG